MVRLCSSLDGFNGVAEERPGELAEAKSFEPLRDVVRHGTLLRQAGFAEALNINFEIAHISYRGGLSDELDRNFRLSIQ